MGFCFYAGKAPKLPIHCKEHIRTHKASLFVHLVKNLKKGDFILRKREQMIVKNIAWVTPCSV